MTQENIKIEFEKWFSSIKANWPSMTEYRKAYPAEYAIYFTAFHAGYTQRILEENNNKKG